MGFLETIHILEKMTILCFNLNVKDCKLLSYKAHIHKASVASNYF